VALTSRMTLPTPLPWGVPAGTRYSWCAIAGTVWTCRVMSNGVPSRVGLGGVGLEGVDVDVLAEPEVDLAAVPGDHHVVALVLGALPPEHLAHFRGLGVAVHREIVALDGIQVVESDRRSQGVNATTCAYRSEGVM
jgi:hypothetical protein